MRRSQKLTR